MIIHPRSVIGTPQPPSGRTRLPVPCHYLLVHYVGAGTYGDGRKPELAEVQSIATYARNVGKPWEYNYLGGWQGGVYEMAGEFMGQHCLNFNGQSMGYQFTLGVGVQPTREAIDAFRQFRAQMVAEGRLTAGHQVTPHYRFRSTTCCAQLAEPRGIAWSSPTGEGFQGDVLPALLEPWNPMPRPEPPPPDPPQEDDLLLTRWQCTDADAAFFGWATADGVAQSVEWCDQTADAIYGDKFQSRRDVPSWGFRNLSFFGDLDALNAAETRRDWTAADFRLVFPAAA